MKLRLATEDDGPELVRFYAETPVTTHIHLRLVKQGSFFYQYQMQSQHSFTYVLTDDHNPKNIKAMVSLLFRPALIEGKVQNVGYVTDLRVANDRRTILEWTHALLPTLQKIKRDMNCTYIFTVVADEQQQAVNAFIRPRNLRRELPRYYLYKRFEVISLHGLWPWSSPPLTSIFVNKAEASDEAALHEYILEKNKGRIPNFHPTRVQIKKNLELWKDLKIEDFLLAKNKAGKIVGCLALWNSQAHEQFIPIKFDSKSLTLKEALHFYSFFGQARKLGDLNVPLNFFYLSYLLADNSDIFYSLCFKAFKSTPKTHFLTYPHFEGYLVTKPAKSFIFSSLRAAMYCVLEPDEQPPEFLRPKILSPPPDFEFAFV